MISGDWRQGATPPHFAPPPQKSSEPMPWLHLAEGGCHVTSPVSRALQCSKVNVYRSQIPAQLLTTHMPQPLWASVSLHFKMRTHKRIISHRIIWGIKLLGIHALIFPPKPVFPAPSPAVLSPSGISSPKPNFFPLKS